MCVCVREVCVCMCERGVCVCVCVCVCGGTHRAGEVSADGVLGEQLQFDLCLPLPAVLNVLMAAKTVLTEGTEQHSHSCAY